MAPSLKIRESDFLKIFHCKADTLPKEFAKEFRRLDTSFRYAEVNELSEYTLAVLKKINSPQIARTKNENIKAFETGWKENLARIKRSGVTMANLKPGYFRKNKFLRYAKQLIVTKNLDIEYELFTMARQIIFKKYLAAFNPIYELGCGACQNLLMLGDMYPDKEIHGLDWAESAIAVAGHIASSLNKNIKGQVFDMFNPAMSKTFKPGSAVFSIHSLEQIGTKYEKLLSFLLKSRPGIVVHYEPVLEFYDENNLLDYLALTYSKKRNYLNGYLTALRRLEKQDKITIIEARRPYLGGVIHEASLIAWKPKL